MTFFRGLFKIPSEDSSGILAGTPFENPKQVPSGILLESPAGILLE